MTKARQTTRAANIPVPQSREEAARFVAEIGTEQRELARIAANMNDAIAATKLEAEVRSTVLNQSVTAKTEGLRIWAEANRVALTDGHKTKTVDLGTGVVAWRLQRAKVTVKGPEDVIEYIIRAGSKLRRFIRTKTEVNREAMLDDVELARTIPGVSIGSDGENFVVEPFEAELSGAA